jgi:hypothetical protein
MTNTKIFGVKRQRTILENFLAQEKLIAELNSSRPFPKKKGLVLKFKTWAELDAFHLQRAVKFVERS